MQARRQDCRISSKPLVVFVPKIMLAGHLHVPASNDAVGVTLRRRRRSGKGLPGVCESARRLALELRPAWRRATARRDLRAFSRRMPYSRIRSALMVLCFSAVSCPRRVCRDAPTACRLFRTQAGQSGQVPEAVGSGTGARHRGRPCAPSPSPTYSSMNLRRISSDAASGFPSLFITVILRMPVTASAIFCSVACICCCCASILW